MLIFVIMNYQLRALGCSKMENYMRKLKFTGNIYNIFKNNITKIPMNPTGIFPKSNMSSKMATIKSQTIQIPYNSETIAQYKNFISHKMLQFDSSIQ